MKLPRPYPLSEICDFLQKPFKGDPSQIITGLNEIHMVEEGDIVFVDHPKYYDKALSSAATTILINKEVDCPEGKSIIISEDPFSDYNKLTTHFRPFSLVKGSRGENTKIHPTALIHESAIVGNNVTIGPYVVIHPGVIIYDHTEIEERTVIHAGTILGSDAFYYKKRPSGYDKMHSCGKLYIGSEVEIGAGCTIDRGVSGATEINSGTKIDNQVHVGHDTVIGENCLIAAQVGIAGCTTIENNVTLWGQVGIRSDVVIGAGAIVMAQSGISKNLDPGKTYFGSPAGEWREKFKEMAYIKHIPEIISKLKGKEKPDERN